jgi:hypothetical protein
LLVLKPPMLIKAKYPNLKVRLGRFRLTGYRYKSKFLESTKLEFLDNLLS